MLTTKHDHQAISGIAVLVIFVTDGLTRSGVTTTYHLQISGGVLLVIVTM